LRDFLDQLRVALEHNLYYLALMGCLVIPDVCGALSSEDGEAKRERYVDWYNKYMSEMCGFFDGQDCYSFRCSMLHQGSTMNPRSSYSRILFLEPGADRRNLILHCNVLNDALNLDVKIFCNTMIEAAERWLDEVSGTELFKTNFNKFIRRYPNGFSPYIVGTPVIG